MYNWGFVFMDMEFGVMRDMPVSLMIESQVVTDSITFNHQTNVP